MRMFQSCSAGRSKDNKSRLFLLKRARPGPSDNACTFPCGLYSKRDHHYFLRYGRQRPFRGNEHEPNRTHFDGCRLFAEFRMLRPFFEHGPRAHWAVGNSVPRVGVGGALFRTSGEVAGTAHRAVSRFVWIDVAVRLAAGADVPGIGAVSQAALGGSFRPAVHLGVLSRGAPRAGGPAAATGLRGAVFAFHVTLSILAYAAFALSFVVSLIFLGEERLLRKHELGNMVWRLPPLELLERMSQSSVLVGLVSIAIGTALGFVSVDRLMGQYWFYDPKYVVTLLVLLL